MTTNVENWDADCRAWGLSPAQRARYLSRISRYYARRARRSADKAVRSSRIATRLAIAALAVLAITQLLGVVL